LIDDGPGDSTPSLLQYLASQNVTATFFVIGANIIKSVAFRRNLKAIDTAGHQIALHSWYFRFSL
jgi:peptidoglycan-N-acetylglucosamine deacetylase